MKKRRFRWLVVLLGLTASAIIPVGGRAEDIHWAYEGALGPEHWKDEFPACGGKSQSPEACRPLQGRPKPPTSRKGLGAFARRDGSGARDSRAQRDQRRGHAGEPGAPSRSS